MVSTNRQMENTMGIQKRKLIKSVMKSAAARGFDPYNSQATFAKLYARRMADKARRDTH